MAIELLHGHADARCRHRRAFPLYLDKLGIDETKSLWALKIVLVYTAFIAFMMVSTIPTYSGKLLGERVQREWVLPIFIVAIGVVAFLFTYPYETLTVLTCIYLGFIPLSWRAFRDKKSEGESSGSRRHRQRTARRTTPPAPRKPPPGAFSHSARPTRRNEKLSGRAASLRYFVSSG